MSKIHKLDAWEAKVIANKFQVFTLRLGKDEFVITVNALPFQCRFPAPNDTLGVNTSRGNSFLHGTFQVTSTGTTSFIRGRGEEMVAVRWATEGGAEILGLDDYNEFWCVVLRNPADGIYLQKNIVLEAGESATIPIREMERNIFVLEGSVMVDNIKELNGFAHATLGKPKEYTVTNHTDKPAFVLYFYEVDRLEFIAAADPSLPQEKYELIPILSEEYWNLS